MKGSAKNSYIRLDWLQMESILIMFILLFTPVWFSMIFF